MENENLAPVLSGDADQYLRDAILTETPTTAAPGAGAPALVPSWATVPTAPTYQPAPQPTYQPQNNWQQPPAPVSSNPYGLPDDQYATYQDALPVITQVLKAEMQPLIDHIRMGQQTQEQQFVGQVRHAVGNFDAMVNDPRWNGYLDSKMPGSPFSYRDALGHAHASRDLGSMKSLFDTFSSGIGQAPAQALVAQGYPPTAIQPATNQNPSHQVSEPPKLKWSTYQKASLAYQKGQLSRDEHMKVRAVYDPAISSGHIAYDQ